MDIIAEHLGLDPLEFRLRNILEEGDEAANGQILHGVGLRECIEKAAAAIGWDQPAGPYRGKGSWWTTTGGLSNSLQPSTERVKSCSPSGRKRSALELSQGGVPQVVAEEMGVRPEEVRIVVADTTSGLWDFGSQGSRTLFNVGRAAQFACSELIQKILDLGEKLLEVPQRSSNCRVGPFAWRAHKSVRFIRRPGQDRPAGRAPGVRCVLTALRLTTRSRGSCLYPAFHYPTFHCHAAEVEVDPGTGEVKVVQYAAAHDVGYAVNPALVEGQIHGGVVQGIGMALMEEIIYEDGRGQSQLDGL